MTEPMQPDESNIEAILHVIRPGITPLEVPAFPEPIDEIAFYLIPGRGIYPDPEGASGARSEGGSLYTVFVKRVKGDGREGGVLSVTSVVLEKGKSLTVWAIPSGDSYRNETAANDALQPGQSLYQIIASRTE